MRMEEGVERDRVVVICSVVAGSDVWFSNMEGYLDSGRVEVVSLLFCQQADRDTAIWEVNVSVVETRQCPKMKC